MRQLVCILFSLSLVPASTSFIQAKGDIKIELDYKQKGKKPARIKTLLLAILVIISNISSCKVQEDNLQLNIIEAMIDNESTLIVNKAVLFEKSHSVNILQLFNSSIESSMFPEHVITSYLNNHEIQLLTSDSELAFLENQKSQKFFWKEVIDTFYLKNQIIESPPLKPSLSYSISAPIVSSDERFAFVYVVITEDVEVATGLIYFLKKDKGEWKVLTSFNQWYS